MSDWLKTAGIIGPLVLGVLWAVFHFGRVVERETIASLPPDTVTVIQLDTVQIVRTLEKLDTVRVRSIDTLWLEPEHPTYIATGDTTVDGVHVSVNFVQSLPIAADAIFRFHIAIPDSLKTVQEKTVFITRTITESELPWHWAVICLLLGFVSGLAL